MEKEINELIKLLLLPRNKGKGRIIEYYLNGVCTRRYYNGEEITRDNINYIIKKLKH